MCNLNAYHHTWAKQRNRKHRTVLLHGHKNGLNYPLECSRSQLGEHSSPTQVGRKKRHDEETGEFATLAEETRRVCNTCPQLGLALPDSPQQHRERILTSPQERTNECPVCSMMWLCGCCLRDLFLSCRPQGPKEGQLPMDALPGGSDECWALVQTLERLRSSFILEFTLSWNLLSWKLSSY